MAYLSTKVIATPGALTLLLWLFIWVFGPGSAALGGVPRDLVLVIQNSNSMKEHDPKLLLHAALSQLVDRLDASTRVGVVTFDQGVALAAPLSDLTREHTQLSVGLKAIDYHGTKSDVAAAIERAMYELKVNGRREADKLIVLVTDGTVSTGNATLDLEKAKWVREDLATGAAKHRIRIFAVGLTDDADFFLLETLSRKTGGAYVRAPDSREIGGAMSQIASLISARKATDREPVPPGVADSAPGPMAKATGDVTAAGSMNNGDLATERQAQADLSDRPAAAGQRGSDPSQTDPVDIALAPGAGRGGWMVIVIGASVIAVAMLAVVPAVQGRRTPSTAPPTVAALDQEVVMGALLRDLSGATGAASFVIGRKATMLGRVAGSDTEHLNYLVVNQATVGRRHAIIEYKDGSFWIIDQGSVNGTLVNGERIFGERRLRHGDRIGVHTYEFEFTVQDLADTWDLVSQPAAVEQRAEPSSAHSALEADAGPSVAAEPDPVAPGSAGLDAAHAPLHGEAAFRAGPLMALQAAANQTRSEAQTVDRGNVVPPMSPEPDRLHGDDKRVAVAIDQAAAEIRDEVRGPDPSRRSGVATGVGRHPMH